MRVDIVPTGRGDEWRVYINGVFVGWQWLTASGEWRSSVAAS